jgi:hypothetical protein
MFPTPCGLDRGFVGAAFDPVFATTPPSVAVAAKSRSWRKGRTDDAGGESQEHQHHDDDDDDHEEDDSSS